MANKVTLITGCSSGIGLNLAVKLGKDAARKYLVYATMRYVRKRESLQAAAGDALNDTLFIRPLDVVKDDSVTNAVNEIIDTHGRIDLLINNAGIATVKPIEYSSLPEVREIFETNFFGVVRMIQAVLPHMKERRSGHIVNVSSITGVLGFPFYDTYCASKHAMEGLTEALAIRMKPFDVNISSVVTGPVLETNINRNIIEGNRLPSEFKLDQLTRDQFNIMKTHSRDQFENMAVTVHDVCNAIQDAIETDHPYRPVRTKTAEFADDCVKASEKYSDFGGTTWVEFIRKMSEEPVSAYLPPNKETQI
ncbi:retinol dehydrogenase 8-like [Lytechinus pictus]|uniref:retinol dehydrogenase 8-like n=1 Tax=Lytechinus pictus TaxID=7653 RepID=UPI0030B9FE45